jgi:hypothetical protein
VADLAYVHSADLSFDNSGNYTTPAFDTSADTWAVLFVYYFTVPSTITSVTYNGASLAGHAYKSAGTTHVAADSVALYAFATGANAGNHTFNIQWSSGGYIIAGVIAGSGPIDAAVWDGTPAESAETVVVTPPQTFTPDPYTPTTDKALPIFTVIGSLAGSQPLTISASSGATFRFTPSAFSMDWGVFTGPLSTPAGTPTAAVFSDTVIEFQETITFALKPMAASATLTIDAADDFDTAGTILMRQRTIGAMTTDVPLSGTYTGADPSGVDAKQGGGAYVALSSFTASSGVWTGTLDNVLPDDITLTVRNADDHAITAVTQLVLGDLFLICGDSIAAGQEITGQTSSATPFYTRGLAGGGLDVWYRMDLTSPPGYYPLLGTLLTTDQQVPVGFLQAGVGGTQTSSWESGAYPNAAAAQLTSGVVDSVCAVLWHIGSNNCALANTPQTRAAVAASLATCVSYLNGQLGFSPVHLFALFGEVTAADLRSDIDQVRLGVLDAVTAHTGVLGPNLIDQAYTDHIHPDNADAQQIADRQWAALTNGIYSGAIPAAPQIVGATTATDGSTVTLTLAPALSNSAASSVGGFRVTDNGTPATISTSVVTNSTHITITPSSALSGPVLVSFGSNNDAAGATVGTGATVTTPDSRSIHLPQLLTIARSAPVVGNGGSPPASRARYRARDGAQVGG